MKTVYSSVFYCAAALAVPFPVMANDKTAALEAVLAGTDPALSRAMSAAGEASPAAAEPKVLVTAMDPDRVYVQDITKDCTVKDEVVSAYPELYELIPREENYLVLKVFRFTDPKGMERRVEVFYTGGDWMRHGMTYFATTAGPDASQARAYYISELSTPDREEGSVPPVISPKDTQRVAGYIAADFLEEDGLVRSSFSSIAAVPLAAK